MNKATNFQIIWNEAMIAGIEAGSAVDPTPMVVVGGVPGGETKRYFESEGVCGFAWVAFAGNTSFGRWAKKAGYARSHYPTGLSYWVGQFNQSMQRKEQFAHAMARVLRSHGIEAHAGSRMD